MLDDPTLPEPYQKDFQCIHQSAERLIAFYTRLKNDLDTENELRLESLRYCSFEMRTPLTSICGFCQLMLEVPDFYSVSLSNAHQLVVAQIDRMGRFLMSITHLGLEYGKLFSETTEVIHEPFIELPDLLEALKGLLNGRFTCEYSGPCPAFNPRDHTFCQILLLLCVEFQQQCPSGNSHLVVQKGEGCIQFLISAVQYEVNAERFARALHSDQRGEPHRHIQKAKTLVEEHGGQFDYLFEEGITFILKFPLSDIK
jgi:hypothetical protein